MTAKHLISTYALTLLCSATPAIAAPDGATLYQIYCVQCHGTKGDGKGINAGHLNVQPRSHIDKTEMAARTDADLFKVISEGGSSINKSILMPAWGHNLHEDDIYALIAHLRKLCCEQ